MRKQALFFDAYPVDFQISLFEIFHGSSYDFTLAILLVIFTNARLGIYTTVILTQFTNINMHINFLFLLLFDQRSKCLTLYKYKAYNTFTSLYYHSNLEIKCVPRFLFDEQCARSS